MTLSIAETAEDSTLTRGLLPLWVGAGVYALFLVGGNRLLIDPDTMWQVTVGQWIIDHHAVPHTDVYSFTMRGQPWISTQWLAQVLFAKAYSLAGWAGPVVLATVAIAATFALLARFLNQRLSDSTTMALVAGALALIAPHLLARPHVLVMPFMLMWAIGLIVAADRGGAPSFALLPLMTLWANLHGGFVFGLALIGPVGLDAVLTAEAKARKQLILRWAVFGLAALAATCITPYGWNALLASKKILELGRALPLIMEWRPVDFGHIGPLEIFLLAGIGLTLLRGMTLPPMRILLLLGLLHMALAQWRAADFLALIAPLVLATPLARQIGGNEAVAPAASSARGLLVASVAVFLAMATVAYAAVHPFRPHPNGAPAAAVAELKKFNPSHVFNAYGFGGYLIANGIAPFIDGRTELYGEKFFLDQDAAVSLGRPEKLFELLDKYKIDATLLRTEEPANRLLDHLDGWQKVYSDDIATVFIRKADARHTAEPAVDPKAD
ncbi:MAG TPA: hypothetical protein VHB49_16840 [Bradyrhizobium sp.]|nr:hypothetical protein [Bradyrhizobium sp.]